MSPIASSHLFNGSPGSAESLTKLIHPSPSSSSLPRIPFCLISLGISSFLPLFSPSLRAQMQTTASQGRHVSGYIPMDPNLSMYGYRFRFARFSLPIAARSCESIDLQMMWSGLGLSSFGERVGGFVRGCYVPGSHLHEIHKS